MYLVNAPRVTLTPNWFVSTVLIQNVPGSGVGTISAYDEPRTDQSGYK